MLCESARLILAAYCMYSQLQSHTYTVGWHGIHREGWDVPLLHQIQPTQVPILAENLSQLATPQSCTDIAITWKWNQHNEKPEKEPIIIQSKNAAKKFTKSSRRPVYVKIIISLNIKTGNHEWNQTIPECSQVFGITHHCTRPRHIDCESKTSINATLSRSTCPREEVAIVISV